MIYNDMIKEVKVDFFVADQLKKVLSKPEKYILTFMRDETKSDKSKQFLFSRPL